MSELPRKRRLELLGSAFVSRKIERDIHDALDLARATRLDEREPKNVVVWGEPGVGKSLIIENYLANRRNITSNHGSLRQDVVAVELEGATSPVLLAAEIAANLGLKDLPRGRTNSDAGPITQAVKHQMLVQGVELVIIDEFHHIAANAGLGTASRVARWVKSLSKKKERSREMPFGTREANIPIVMVGTKSVRDLVIKDPELLSITPKFFEIGRYTHDDPAQQKRWQLLLTELDDKLPFNEFSELGDQDRAFRIHQVTHGYLRQLGHLIGEAGRLAIDRGHQCILDEDLYDSVESQRALLEVKRISDSSDVLDKTRPISNPFDGGDLEAMMKRGVLEGAEVI